VNSNFITNSSGNVDWRNPQNNNLWQGVSGINNPCPIGYRLPTETELINQRASWVSYNPAGALGSSLKLPMAGRRVNSNGTLSGGTTDAHYWSSSVSGTNSTRMHFDGNGSTTGPFVRALGYTVRCIANDNPSNGTAIVSAYDCSTASAGTMTAGTAISSGVVTQTITAAVTTVGTYNISSTTANGVTFAGTGTFTGTGNQQIVLTATGTPTYGTTDAFTFNTNPNCTFNRTTTGNASSNGTAVVSGYSCSTATAGNLNIGINTTGAGVTQTITANVTTSGTYSISTTANGVTFVASGTFAGTGYQT